MTYQEAIKFLFEALPVFQTQGAGAYKPGLERVEALLEACGNPHKKLMTIHVAGTNGKGSVSHLLASILSACGLRVGLFTSPHLVRFEERIRVNGEMISEEAVIDFVQKYNSLPELAPSFFEYTTAMAFSYFIDSEVDLAVVEVGMGGRLDSTNVVDPILSVITNVSIDHAAFLGGTLGEIAREKGGIIKPERPVVLGRSQEREVLQVIEEIASKRQAPLYLADKEELIERFAPLPRGGHRFWTKDFGVVDNPLEGAFQIENTRTVLQVLRLLTEWIPTTSLASRCDWSYVKEGFAQIFDTGLRGRFEELPSVEGVRVWIDTGHNPGAWAYLSEELAHRDRSHGLVVVMGMAADKDVLSVLSQLPRGARYVFSKAQGQRSMPASQLLDLALEVGLQAEAVEDVVEAFEVALRRAKTTSRGGIFVGGSNFLVGELLDRLEVFRR